MYAAKSLQSCPTPCDPMDSSPPRSPVPGILQARTLEWVAISFSNAGKWKVKVKSLSRVWLLATPWTAAYQAPPSMGFSRQEYWSGVPLPSPMLYSRFSLIIYFICSSMYVSIPISQLIPPPTSTFGNHKLVFYICDAISALQITSSVHLLRFHTYTLIYRLFVLCTIGSRFIHLVKTDSNAYCFFFF